MFGKTPRWKLFTALFAVLTVGIMALFFNIYEPWQPVGPERIPDGTFNTTESTNGWKGWNQQVQWRPNGGLRESPCVELTTTPLQNGLLTFTVRNLDSVPAIRVSLRATTKDVVRGTEKTHTPRATFCYYNAQAERVYALRHSLAEIPGDTGWRRYKRFFPVPDGATKAQLDIWNLGSAGVLKVDDVSIIPVHSRTSAPWWKLLFGILWTTSFGLCLFALRPWARRYGLLIMVTLFLVMTGIVLPGQILDSAIEKTIRTAKRLTVNPRPPPAQAVNAVVPSGSGAAKPAVLKKELVAALTQQANEEAHRTGHLSLFSLLALLSTLSWLTAPSLRRATTVYAGLAFFAASTEVLQFITPDRSATLGDLYVDMSGMAGAVVLVSAIRYIQRLIRRD